MTTKWTPPMERDYRSGMRWMAVAVLAWLSTVALAVAVLVGGGNALLVRLDAVAMLIGTWTTVIGAQKWDRVHRARAERAAKG